MTAIAVDTGAAAPSRQGQFRYGVVFLIVLAFLIFEIVAPDTDWARAVDVALAGAALTVTVATSRARGKVRRVRALWVGGTALVVVTGIATGLFSAALAFAVLTLLAVAVPLALTGGLLRLNKDAGVTLQVVAGALAIYLLIGLLFASIVSFVAHVQSTPYFTQGSPSNGDRVYYSFTVLTTTGFGDYTAAMPVGHALAVLEMLTGQLYLVTVIGILVGNFTGRRA